MDLADIKAGLAFIDVHALVIQKSTGTTKTGKIYADVTLRDGNFTLKCKKWSYNAEKYDEILASGKVVKISGTADLYNNELQGTITLADASDRSPNDFARKSRFDSETLFAKIIEVIDTFEDPLPKYVASTLLHQYKDDFCRSPAALGLHHSWFGGLLEHTYSMVALASRIGKYYQEQYGMGNFSRDRLLCGIMLHDLGKIFEYDSSTPAFKMTASGVLVNHLVKGPILVYEAATKWYDNHGRYLEGYPSAKFEHERDLLVHLIASHHGKIEWGSPVMPSCLEAILIHQIDKIDSSVMHALEFMEGEDGEVEGFSKRCYMEKVQYLKA